MDLDSREIEYVDMETMGQHVEIKVLISGFNGLGSETNQSLILLVPKHHDLMILSHG